MVRTTTMAEGRAERRLESSNNPGYVCNCTDGYQGNPYVIDGCAGVLLLEARNADVGMFRVPGTSFRNAERERHGTTSPKRMERRSGGAGTWRRFETIQTRFLDIPEVSQCLTVVRRPAGGAAKV
jgi:hypothetical protein